MSQNNSNGIKNIPIENKPEITNKQIIERFLKRKKSKYTRINRGVSVNYFITEAHFGYSGHIFDINKKVLIDYHDWLDDDVNLTLSTKKQRWNDLTCMINFVNEYYDEDMEKAIVIPKHSIGWSDNGHKESESNKDVVLTKKEVEKLLTYYKMSNHKLYLVFRILVETGMRIGEFSSIKIKDADIKKRILTVRGKTGKKAYYMTISLARELEYYINNFSFTSEYLFTTKYGNPYSANCIRGQLKHDQKKKLKIDKRITAHTFRRTINTERKKMGCSSEDRKILLNHKAEGVNYSSYVKLNYEDFINLYDKWFPYINLNF